MFESRVVDVRRWAAWLCLSLASAAWAQDPPGASSVPLRPAGSGAGSLFALLPPGETGIDFVSALKRPHQIPYINTGAGVAIGDVDGDGRADVYLLSTDSPNKLYRQTGTWRFEDVTARAGVDGGAAWSRGAAFADIDGDGDLDLYVCNTEAPNLLYVNQGDGTFVEQGRQFGLAHAAASIMAYFADYDRDGDLDMYLLTYRVLHQAVPDTQIADVVVPADTVKTIDEMRVKPVHPIQEDGRQVPENPEDWADLGHDRWELAGQLDRLFRNDGDGTFTDVTEAAGVIDYGLGLSAAWMDFDRDGWLDLYVGNDLTTRDRIWRNNGDGTFTNVLEYLLPHTTWFSMGSDFGDVNNDGRLDFYVADMAGSSHYRAKRNMGDINTFRYFLENEWPRQKMQNALFLATGLARYVEVSALAGVERFPTYHDYASALLTDIYAEDSLRRAEVFEAVELESGILFGDGAGSFDWRPLPRMAQASPGYGMVASDVDGDGHTDLYLVQNSFTREPETGLLDGGVSMLLYGDGRGDFRVSDPGESGLMVPGDGKGLGLGDLNRDGWPDLVATQNNGSLVAFGNHGIAGHGSLAVRLSGPPGNPAAVGARVTLERSDGHRQTAEVYAGSGYLSQSSPTLFFGLGTAEARHLEVRWPDGAESKHPAGPGPNLPLVHPALRADP